MDNIETIRDFVKHFSDGYYCLPQQQMPYETGKAAGIQYACKEIVKFIDSLKTK